MENKLITSTLLVLSFLIATASLSNAQSSIQISATGLTCSSPSPSLVSRQFLSGANVSLSCDGGLTVISRTTTDASGSFALNVSVVAVPTSLPPACRIFVAVPSNCTIIKLNTIVNTLVSLSISRVLFASGLFVVRLFVAL